MATVQTIESLIECASKRSTTDPLSHSTCLALCSFERNVPVQRDLASGQIFCSLKRGSIQFYMFRVLFQMLQEVTQAVPWFGLCFVSYLSCVVRKHFCSLTADEDGLALDQAGSGQRLTCAYTCPRHGIDRRHSFKNRILWSTNMVHLSRSKAGHGQMLCASRGVVELLVPKAVWCMTGRL